MKDLPSHHLLRKREEILTACVTFHSLHSSSLLYSFIPTGSRKMMMTEPKWLPFGQDTMSWVSLPKMKEPICKWGRKREKVDDSCLPFNISSHQIIISINGLLSFSPNSSLYGSLFQVNRRFFLQHTSSCFDISAFSTTSLPFLFISSIFTILRSHWIDRYCNSMSLLVIHEKLVQEMLAGKKLLSLVSIHNLYPLFSVVFLHIFLLNFWSGSFTKISFRSYDLSYFCGKTFIAVPPIQVEIFNHTWPYENKFK